jgi:branched-chain amino acid transport system ATP-binding protein
VIKDVRVAAETGEKGLFSYDIYTRADHQHREYADEILDRIYLTEERNTIAKNLSHGDQRRLGIAISLATDPDMLLLDEPTSGMGPEATRETASLIEGIGEEFDIPIVIIEHDMNVVMEISDRISVLYNGTHLATGSPEEIREDDEVQDAYLGGLKEEEGEV